MARDTYCFSLRADGFAPRFHSDELAENPSEWTPWSYRKTLVQVGTRVDSG